MHFYNYGNGNDEEGEVGEGCEENDYLGPLAQALVPVVFLTFCSEIIFKEGKNQQTCEDLEQNPKDQVHFAR